MAAGVVVTVGAATAVAVVSLPATANTAGTLPGGTSISVDVATPTNGAHVAAGSQVVVSGSASVGARGNQADTSLVTAIDVSGSTSSNAGTTACGNADADGTSNDVLDCEAAGAIALNNAAASAGTIADAGAVIFGSTAVTGDVSPATGDQLRAAPSADVNANSKPDVNEVFGSVFRSGVGQFTGHTIAGSTNFTAAITAANTVLTGSAGTHKLFAFLSDGVANLGGSTLSAINARPPGTVIDTFAVGSGSTCGSATDPNQQSLAYIASHGGGTCRAVTSPGDLVSILPGLITSQLNSLTLTDNSGTPTTITNTTPALPINGPGSVNYTITTPPLAPGSHQLCVTATGSDPATGTVQECKTVIVDPYHIVVRAQPQSRAFGQPNPTLTFTVSGLQGTDTLTTQPTCTTTATATSNVGGYPIHCSGATADPNKYDISYVDSSLTVTPAASVVSGPTVSKVFGQPDPSFAPIMASNGAPVPAGAMCTAPTPHDNVGTYTLTCTGPSAAGNYSYTYTNGTLTVRAAAAEVDGPTVHKAYGAPDPSFTPTVTNGAPLPSDAKCTAPDPHVNVGTYTLTCTGSAAQGNYTYTYKDGLLIIDPAVVTVTAQDAVKNYGDPDPAFTPSVSGLQNGDSLPSSVVCTAASPHTNVGTYAITCTGPNTSGNYSFVYRNPATLTVQKATPTVGTTPSGTTALGGFASDTATLTHTGAATGGVTFNLYGPGDTTCSNPVGTATNRSLTSNVARSGGIQVVSGAGTYRWTATYAGDSNNNPSVSGCNEELFTVVGQRLTGRAFGISVTSSLLGIPLVTVPPLPDTGPVATTSSVAVEPPCLANIALLVGVQADCAFVGTFSGYPATSVAASSLASAQVPIATLPLISVGAVQAQSATSCAGSIGSTTIAYLAVGSVVVISKPTAIAPNTTLNVGVVKLVLNEQKAFTTPDKGLTVNAIHITVNTLGLANADVVISSAESDISGCP